MTLKELIDANHKIFSLLPNAIHQGADPDVVDEYWFEKVIGQQSTADGEDNCLFIVRLSLYQESSGDIKADVQLVNSAGEEGEVDRSFIPMRNMACMRADLKAEIDKWEIPSPDIDFAAPLLLASEQICLMLADEVLCKTSR